ncbi:hypothetical protein EYF80_068332 [Liparis tanakae]|uniref:Uncharacterized protein n=1 Tax=Liparis tanakae TaxID=230148 RepID=A0A4Z2DYH3_9TELE|nr:hypothetical protein EYF80_068332 [Liparis tanakae]
MSADMGTIMQLLQRRMPMIPPSYSMFTPTQAPPTDQPPAATTVSECLIRCPAPTPQHPDSSVASEA